MRNDTLECDSGLHAGLGGNTCEGSGRTMSRIDVGQLSSAQESLLIPLWARAAEASHSAPIIRDEKAVELVEAIDYPFERFANAGVDSVGFCLRGTIIDRLVQRFLESSPTATVVEIGAGLDTRFDRLDNRQASWIEVDLPEAMGIRKKLFQETDRRCMIGASALENEWLDSISESGPTSIMFVAEGMLYFLPPEQVRRLFLRLADRFPGSRFVFDSQSPLFLRFNNFKQPVAGAKMLWALRRQKEIERWDPRYVVEESIGFGDPRYYQQSHLRRLPLLQRAAQRLWPPSRHMFRISQVRLGTADESIS